MVHWIALFSGGAILLAGIFAASLLNGAEMAITREERLSPEPTLLGRVLVICLGLCMMIFGAINLLAH